MTITLLQGDCREVLTTLPDQSVQCVVTSPPYWGLRKYSDDPREIGNESTPADYVQALLAVFAEVWRVLRDDGTLWLNLGDAYANDTKWGGKTSGKHAGGLQGTTYIGRNRTQTGLPSKSLIGLPWRVAFALQDAGWTLRSEIIWHKTNPMPESVDDRPTRNHEHIFLFAKNHAYYYDAVAIAEPAMSAKNRGGAHKIQELVAAPGALNDGFSERWQPTDTRNKRTVWSMASQPYPDAHFATFPERLVEPCILAGSSPQACPCCGAPWKRIIERTFVPQSDVSAERGVKGAPGQKPMAKENGWEGVPRGTTHRTTAGWRPTCRCEDNDGSARSVVLDPFGGSGTVGRVAERYQRNAILIDLTPSYIELQEQRTDGVQIELFI